jgi:hypothetical protein
MLKSKLEDLAKKLGYNYVKTKGSWLSQWKQRLGIKFLKAHGEEEDSVDVVK